MFRLDALPHWFVPGLILAEDCAAALAEATPDIRIHVGLMVWSPAGTWSWLCKPDGFESFVFRIRMHWRDENNFNLCLQYFC
jgi:hypothetical protein